MRDSLLRKDVLDFIEKGLAHVSIKHALDNLKSKYRHQRPSSDLQSIWEELEHMRIAQEDILRYTLNASWKSPEWPEGYWPAREEPFSDEKWESTLSGFYSDSNELISLIKDESIDLTEEIPHGEGRTYLREILLIIDHNAYHLGKIVQIRKMLGVWR
jgi:uncharacterized damage-inducible protein DinB